ncbi:transglycosylase domain-containing protein [Dactylosporangium darangshiense]|uniref:Transglycosylase domain-containing protein n=1 Tax=Dactylosporangium darangshiense TaxID=579108 RepID=A0ABP8D0N1_9ACTN
MRLRGHVALKSLASLLLCGLFAGVVVAAAVFPGLAASGLAAKGGSDAFENLPTDLDVLPSPQISYIYASDGTTLLAMMYDENRRDVPISDVSPAMQQAIVAAEDTRFYEHRGVDLKGVARAFVNNENGGDQQGASTLTMQYVREATAYSAQTPQEVVDATAKTSGRKLREMKLAMALEKKLTKQQILEKYLNISPFGHGAYGIYAAAHVYFNKDPKDLSLAESALLAGLVKAPSTNDPATADGLPKAIAREGYVLDQMVALKYITAQQRDEAKATKLTIVGQRTPEGCESVQRADLGAGFLCDYLRRWWLDQPAFGADELERENRLHSGGYTIISSLNVKTQAAAFKYAKDQPEVGSSEKVGMGNPEAVMVAAVEPGTGRVQALATNRNFSNDQTNNKPSTNPAKKGQKGNYPNTTVPFITGGPDVPGYQAGSSFKIFTAVAALESGIPLSHTEDVQAQFVSDYPIDANSPAACNGPHYCPRNSTGDPVGTFNMWQGFGLSLNTYFVPLEQRVGADHVVDVAKRLGIQFRSPSDAAFAKDAKEWGAFTLGVSDTTPLDLANAYATLAADGMYCAPTPITEIKDLKGNKVDAGQPKCRSVVSADVARAAVDMARCPVGDQSAFNACPNGGTATGVRGDVGRPVAGKTGTTDSGKSATFVAMTKQLAVAGILTDPDNPQTNRTMSHPVVNNAVAYTLKAGLQGLPVVNFTAPSRQKAFGSN